MNKLLIKVQESIDLSHKTTSNIFSIGDKVKNINSSCVHYKSEGMVTHIEALPDRMGDIVHYKATNSGEYWKEGETLKKTESQLTRAGIMMMNPREPSAIMDMMDNMSDTMADVDPNRLQEPVFQTDPIVPEQPLEADDEESPSEEEDFSFEEQAMVMAITSLKSSTNSLLQILSSLNNPGISDNLTEPWLVGKIAVVEDYVNTIYTYVMFASKESEENTDAGSKPGLWDNIRKKRERMGKKYKPAKPGDKGRPNPSQWNKLTK